MPCEEYRPLVKRLGSGELPPEQERLLDEHLPGCPSCRKAVALIRMDDAALSNALLGLEPGARSGRGSSRILRTTLLLGIVMGVLLVVIYGLYGIVEDRLKESEKARLGAAALGKTVLTRMVDVDLARLLAKFEEQARTSIDFEMPEGSDSGTPLVTLDLDDGIRLESALLLLSEFHGVTFTVGEDRVAVPGDVEKSPAKGDIEKRLDAETATLSYGGNDLAGALRHIGNVKGLNLVVAPSAAEELARTPARLDVTNRNLRDILNDLLTPSGLSFEVRHEVVLIR
jgi:hypothetical protein